MKKTLEKVIKKHAVIAVFSVIAVVIVVMSTTYAIFNSSHKNNEDQKIDIGTFDVTVTSSTGQIIITDIYPSTESNAKANSTYVYTIENTGTYKVSYTASLVDNTTSFKAGHSDYNSYPALPLAQYSNIDYKYDNTNPGNLGSMSTATGTKIQVGSGTLNPGATETHQIKFWLDNNAPNDVIGKMLALQLVVDATATS